jgi:hypothetical protein
MYDWKNTLLCSFEKGSPRITAYDVHEWIDKALNLQEEVGTIEVDGLNRQVFVKFNDGHRGTELLQNTAEEICDHSNGICSRVKYTRQNLAY